MKLFRTICMSAILGLVLLSGCSGSKLQSEYAALDGTITAWQADTANPLMAYVPSDAALVVSTMRKRDLNSRGMEELFQLASEVLDRSVPRHVRKLFKSYRSYSQEFGLDPNAKTDCVFYVHDGKAVMYLTLVNEDKFLDTIAAGSMSQVDNWLVANGDDVSVSLHIQNSVLTLVVAEGKGRAFPELLSAQKKHFVPNVTNSDAIIYSYIHYANLVDAIVKLPPIADDLDRLVRYNKVNEKYLNTPGYTSVKDEGCVRDLKSMVSDLNTSQFELTLSDNGSLGFVFDTSVSVGLAGDLKALMNDHILLGDPEAKLNGHVSLSIDKSLQLLRRIFLSPRDWKCAHAAAIQKEIVDEFDIDELDDVLQDDEYIDYFKDFKSASVLFTDVIDINRIDRIVDSPSASLPRGIIHLEHSPNLFKLVTHELGVSISEGAVTPVPISSNHQLNLLVSGSHAYISSIPLDANRQFQHVTDHFVDMEVQRSFITNLLGESLPTNFNSGYHLNFTIRNNDLIFSLLPIND